MARVSLKQLEQLATVLNRAFEARGSTARVVVGARYDYHALDLTTADYLENHSGAMVKSLCLGRTGELDTYMRAMLEALWLVSEPYTDPATGPARLRARRARG
jgi:hypothetical protein